MSSFTKDSEMYGQRMANLKCLKLLLFKLSYIFKYLSRKAIFFYERSYRYIVNILATFL